MDAKAPAKVIAMGGLYRWKSSRDVPDTLNAVLEYPEGFTVNLSATFNNQASAEGSFQFLGTEGTINLAGGLTFLPEHPVEDNRWVVDSWPTKLADAYYADPKVQATELVGTQKQSVIAGPQQFLSRGRDSTIPHMGHWLESIRTRKRYWEDALTGHRAAACAHMINQSAATGKLVEWDFAKDDIRA